MDAAVVDLGQGVHKGDAHVRSHVRDVHSSRLVSVWGLRRVAVSAESGLSQAHDTSSRPWLQATKPLDRFFDSIGWLDFRGTLDSRRQPGQLKTAVDELGSLYPLHAIFS